MKSKKRHRRAGNALFGSRKLRRIATAVVVALLAFIVNRYGPVDEQSSKGRPPEQIEGRAKAIDGDSLRVGSHEVRLVGIDAPEGRQKCQRKGVDWPCGQRSANRLRSLVGRSTVRCDVDKRDKHRRLLATCHIANSNLNKRMVGEGWAVSYGKYKSQERAAKAARKGIWSGTFMRPRKWRDKYMRRR